MTCEQLDGLLTEKNTKRLSTLLLQVGYPGESKEQRL